MVKSSGKKKKTSDPKQPGNTFIVKFNSITANGFSVDNDQCIPLSQVNFDDFFTMHLQLQNTFSHKIKIILQLKSKEQSNKYTDPLQHTLGLITNN